jgi:hypothetical protein
LLSQYEASVVIPPPSPAINLVSPKGRKKLVSESVISIVQKLTYESNVAGDSMSSREILKLVEIERHKELAPYCHSLTLILSLSLPLSLSN